MEVRMKNEIRDIVQEVVWKLRHVRISVVSKDNKRRVENVLRDLKNAGVITDFLSGPNGYKKRFEEFLITAVKDGRHKAFGLTIKRTERMVRMHREKQDWLREQISQYRPFIEQIAVAVYNSKTDKSLKKALKKAIRQYKES